MSSRVTVVLYSICVPLENGELCPWFVVTFVMALYELLK